MIYFTADFHFLHDKIIIYCKRPFGNARHMQSVIIKNYNNIVTDDDTVYILGDLTIAGPNYRWAVQKLIQQLGGRKHLILGNHDEFDPFTYVKMGFESVHTGLWLEKHDLYLTHDPANAIVDMDKTWLCGHIHQHWKQISNTINVGVDVWDFQPVSIEEINKIR